MIGPDEKVLEEVLEEVGACFCESCGRIGIVSILLVSQGFIPCGCGLLGVNYTLVIPVSQVGESNY